MNSSFKRWLIALASLAAVFASGAATANAEVEKLIKDANYWAYPGGNYWNWRYSELKQINATNAGKLQAAWTFSTGVLRGHEGGPLVLPASATGLKGDTLFIHAAFPNNVFAINLDTLEVVWEYVPVQDYDETVPVMCCDTVNRGLGYGDGKILLQQADTTLVALDAKSGKPVWSVKNGDPKVGQTNTNAPHVFKDKVFTGISGGEFGVRGWVAAYNLKDGKLAWKGYSMGPDSDMLMDPNTTMTFTDGKMAPVGKDSSLKTWQGDQWKIGGGTTWGWYSYDPELNAMFYGNGNPSTWNPKQRPGDNKWSMSLWSRDVDSGKVNWVYQMTPHDEWDFDGINEVPLFEGKDKNGKERKMLAHFDRNGFGYTLDRKTGELLVAEKFDPAVNWATHVDMKTGRPQVVAKYSTHQNGEDVNSKGICPAALGTKDQQPAAYDPVSGLFLVPTNHVCMDYEPFRVEYTAGQPYVGATLAMFPAPNSHGGMGNFIGWDPIKGKIVWSIPEKFSVWSGAMTTATGLAFYGTLDARLKAVDIKAGKVVWTSPKLPSGVIGNVHSWEFQGKQYIGILTGIGGWAGIGMAAGLEKDSDGLGAVGGYKELAKYGDLGGTLMVFALAN